MFSPNVEQSKSIKFLTQCNHLLAVLNVFLCEDLIIALNENTWKFQIHGDEKLSKF